MKNVGIYWQGPMGTGPGFAKPSRDLFLSTPFCRARFLAVGASWGETAATASPAITPEAPAVTGPWEGPLAGYAFTFLYIIA